MNNADYWRGRFGILEQAANKRGMDYVATLDEQFRQASQSVQSEINAWYQRFATNNGITMAEAKKWLTSSELSEFRWTVQDYIKYGESLDPKWAKALENASSRVHISRLESIQLQMQQQIEVLYGNQVDGLDKTLRSVYSNGYYHTAFEIQRGFNLGWDLQSLNSEQLDSVLSRPWSTDMQTFRDRCWTNKAELVSTVQTQLSQAIIRGDSPDKAIDAISKKFNVSKSKAGRLVMTESAYFSSQAQKDCFNELDVEMFEIVATLDDRTSEICQDLDGTVARMTDYEPGVTAPPFHPWCRSTTVPYFDDNFGERAARDQDGNVYYVPADMKYKDWKQTFVNGGDKSGMTAVDESGIIKNQTLAEKIQAVKDRIKDNGGKIVETDIKEAGEAVRSEIETARKPKKAAFEKVKAEYDANPKKLRYDELGKRVTEVDAQCKQLSYGDPRLGDLQDERSALWSERHKLWDDEELSTLRKKVRTAQSEYEGTWEFNSQQLKKKLSEFRTCGVNGHDMKVEHYSNRGTLRQKVTDAYDCYPSDWVDASIAKGKIDITKVQRGFYNGYEIAVSGDDPFYQMQTAFHELGHRFEDVIPGIYEAEDVFYKRRTAGESLQWLGRGYGKSERTRTDKFIHPYMGKEYPTKFYELCSMGFEYAYTNPNYLMTDQDFAQFIYGILSLY